MTNSRVSVRTCVILFLMSVLIASGVVIQQIQRRDRLHREVITGERELTRMDAQLTELRRRAHIKAPVKMPDHED